MQRAQAGQSLIEVTFATAVVAMVLIAVLSSIILSLRNARSALEQTKATEHAQAALEWLRRERDLVGWGVFSSSLSNRGGTLTLCIPSMPADYAALMAEEAGACAEEQVIPDTPYRREVTLTTLSASQVEVQVSVIRPGLANEATSTLRTILSDWE